MLINVLYGKRVIQVSVALEEIYQVGIARLERDYRYAGDTYSYVKLRNGKRYILTHEEAQRLINILHQSEGNQ